MMLFHLYLLYILNPCTQVYLRLQKMLLSISHQRLLAYLDVLGEKFDEKVKKWKLSIEDAMQSSRVMVMFIVVFVS